MLDLCPNGVGNIKSIWFTFLIHIPSTII